MILILVINLFGVPGSGKSTGAAYIFSMLKMKGINAELITEFAKDMVWEGNVEAFKNQAYIFGEQSFKMSRCRNKVDVLVTDSPLPLSILYNKDEALDSNFDKTVMQSFNSYANLNYLICRVKPYNQSGRNETEMESDALQEQLIGLMETRNIQYRYIRGDLLGYQDVIEDVKSLFSYKE